MLLGNNTALLPSRPSCCSATHLHSTNVHTAMRRFHLTQCDAKYDMSVPLLLSNGNQPDSGHVTARAAAMCLYLSD